MRKLLAFVLLLGFATPALAGGYVLENRVLTVTGSSAPTQYFGGYNYFQIYQINGKLHVDYQDPEVVMSNDFPLDSIDSITCNLLAVGQYSMNGAVNITNIPMFADVSSAQYGEIFSPSAVSTFVVGGFETFGYLNRESTIIGYSEMFYIYYSD